MSTYIHVNNGDQELVRRAQQVQQANRTAQQQDSRDQALQERITTLQADATISAPVGGLPNTSVDRRPAAQRTGTSYDMHFCWYRLKRATWNSAPDAENSITVWNGDRSQSAKVTLPDWRAYTPAWPATREPRYELVSGWMGNGIGSTTTGSSCEGVAGYARGWTGGDERVYPKQYYEVFALPVDRRRMILVYLEMNRVAFLKFQQYSENTSLGVDVIRENPTDIVCCITGTALTEFDIFHDDPAGNYHVACFLCTPDEVRVLPTPTELISKMQRLWPAIPAPDRINSYFQGTRTIDNPQYVYDPPDVNGIYFDVALDGANIDSSLGWKYLTDDGSWERTSPGYYFYDHKDIWAYNTISGGDMYSPAIYWYLTDYNGELWDRGDDPYMDPYADPLPENDNELIAAGLPFFRAKKFVRGGPPLNVVSTTWEPNLFVAKNNPYTAFIQEWERLEKDYGVYTGVKVTGLQVGDYGIGCWDGGNPRYCIQQVTALGFDLTG